MKIEPFSLSVSFSFAYPTVLTDYSKLFLPSSYCPLPLPWNGRCRIGLKNHSISVNRLSHGWTSAGRIELPRFSPAAPIWTRFQAFYLESQVSLHDNSCLVAPSWCLRCWAEKSQNMFWRNFGGQRRFDNFTRIRRARIRRKFLSPFLNELSHGLFFGGT